MPQEEPRCCANFMAQPSYNALVADYASARMQGRRFGIVFLLAFGLGSVAGTDAGLVAENLGTRWVFFSLARFALVIFMASIALWVYGRKQAPLPGSGARPQQAR